MNNDIGSSRSEQAETPNNTGISDKDNVSKEGETPQETPTIFDEIKTLAPTDKMAEVDYIKLMNHNFTLVNVGNTQVVEFQSTHHGASRFSKAQFRNYLGKWPKTRVNVSAVDEAGNAIEKTKLEKIASAWLNHPDGNQITEEINEPESTNEPVNVSNFPPVAYDQFPEQIPYVDNEIFREDDESEASWKKRRQAEEQKQVKLQLKNARPKSQLYEGAYVALLNKYFSFVFTGSEYLYVLKRYNKRKRHNEFFWLSQGTFIDMLAKWPKCLVYSGQVDKNTGEPIYKPVDAWKVWKESPEGIEYAGGVTFDPLKQDPDEFNLWQGYSADPVENRELVNPYLKHIYNVICNEDKVTYRYVIDWLAHMIQYPEVLPMAGIILISEEGSGKGMMMRPYKSFLGDMYLHALRKVTGQFNSKLFGKLFIFWDEGFAGTKEDTDSMKTMITEDTMEMEKKHKDVIIAPHLGRVIIATNHDNILSIGKSSRRYLFLKIPFEKHQDKPYYQQLADTIDDPNFAPALLHYLESRDIENFVPHDIPKTKELFHQKVAGMQAEDLFWLGSLARWVQHEDELLISNIKFLDKAVDWIFHKYVKDNFNDSTYGKKGFSYSTKYLRANGYFESIMATIKSGKTRPLDTTMTLPEQQSRITAVYMTVKGNTFSPYNPLVRDENTLLDYLLAQTAKNMQTDLADLIDYLESAPIILDSWHDIADGTKRPANEPK